MSERLSVADDRKLKLRKLKARRLTAEQVANLRAARAKGATYEQLGVTFGLSTVAAYNAARGITYAETHPDPYEAGQAARRFSTAKQNQRRRELATPNLTPSVAGMA